ncbi:MAG: polysaccharide deacetylase family protein [Lachnospiraceae bacterium]|nr:polysaccharide deacetylase family protein [Lachnospiraceae bacterium]
MSENKYIALTFDDGPSDTTSLKVLNTLKKYGVTGTFFLIGDNITPEREYIVREELAYGCEIENHSLTHSDMRTLDRQTITAEIEETTRRIVSITGKEPMFFRPPYINVNDLMLETIPYIFICGYGCEDWVPSVGAEERARRVIENARDGEIVLLHDTEGNGATAEALDIIIPVLLSRGFCFVTLRELFERAGITPENARKIVYSYTDDQ